MSGKVEREIESSNTSAEKRREEAIRNTRRNNETLTQKPLKHRYYSKIRYARHVPGLP